jgi:DNA-binding NtrC family response regulator
MRRKNIPKATTPSTKNAPIAMHAVEKRHILSIYRQTDSNKSETARQLEISLSTLRRKLEEYGVA